MPHVSAPCPVALPCSRLLVAHPDGRVAAGDFDYGGAAFMGPLLTDYNVSAPRELLKVGGKYWFTNFAQPLRDACEPPPGATGLASSTDGIDWQRASAVSPST